MSAQRIMHLKNYGKYATIMTDRCCCLRCPNTFERNKTCSKMIAVVLIIHAVLKMIQPILSGNILPMIVSIFMFIFCLVACLLIFLACERGRAIFMEPMFGYC
ncbi:hypothetical protein PENTCL1PPCAC_24349, partial [Pristionchus entomophagus]